MPIAATRVEKGRWEDSSSSIGWEGEPAPQGRCSWSVGMLLGVLAPVVIAPLIRPVELRFGGTYLRVKGSLTLPASLKSTPLYSLAPRALERGTPQGISRFSLWNGERWLSIRLWTCAFWLVQSKERFRPVDPGLGYDQD
jgi:hypothetical protein